MMIKNVLVAVDDSAPGLAAARTGVALARACGARLRAVVVLADDTLAEVLAPMVGDGGFAVAARRAQAQSVLRYVLRLASEAGVRCETAELDGEVAQQVLREAASWPADLVVIGRSDTRTPGQPYIGSHTRHVLEFAEQPVVVCPSAPPPTVG